MEHSFWHNCWEKNAIGFHQESLHPFLNEQVLSNVRNTQGTILVPLCGKSLDMLWWAERCNVVGSELSEIACADFFDENQLNVTVEQVGEFNHYQVKNLSIYQGDFFKLLPTQFSAFDYIYDRAAIIALPFKMREKYAAHLTSFIADSTTLFLMTLEYPEGEHQGPPFSVSSDEVRQLFTGFDITELASRDLTGKKFAMRSLPVSKLTERLFKITRSNT